MRAFDGIKFELAKSFGVSSVLMHTLREQFYFGAREVLLKYMGLSEATIILADLQHGIPRMSRTSYSVFGIGSIPDLIWCHNTFTFDKNFKFTSGKKTLPIGAPWLYMKENLKQNNELMSPKLSQNKDTLLILPHSGNYEVIDLNFEFNAFLDTHKVDGVLLFNEDFLNPKIREILVQKNILIECAGLPRTYQPTAYHTIAGGRANFLEESFRIFSRYRNVISTRFSTALIYAADVGANIGIFNDWEADWKFLSSTEGQILNHKKVLNENLEKFFPFDVNKIHDSTSVTQWANEILGVSHLMSKEEIVLRIPFKENVLPLYK